MANWTLQHLNCLVRKYTHLAEGRMTSLTQWTWVWGNSGRQWRTGKPGMLQSMRSQSVRHDWVTEQQSKNTRNVQACSLFSLSSLFSEKGKKKTHSSFFFFFFLFTATLTPRGSPAFPGGWAQTPRASHFPCAPMTVSSPPESMASAHTNSPLWPQPWPKPDPSIRTFKTPCPHGASHTPSQYGISEA